MVGAPLLSIALLLAGALWAAPAFVPSTAGSGPAA
eukprot:CAMPEP_0117589906 /NCGR_PEP_ID=MMETSP0784-20121206/70673_1 /TAXON_ID=39447 /ORGANISM="" /LENGTH=34 /DNA_ID= /DNA_START= /DNA_END= /DNA_ORIENTATION=